VVVTVHGNFRDPYRRWVRSLSPNPLDARLLAETYFRTVQERLVAHGGFPPDAVPDVADGRETFWVELCGGTWVRYVIADESRWLSLVRSRTVELIGLSATPPPPASPTRTDPT
jgi:hypothetical protein